MFFEHVLSEFFLNRMFVYFNILKKKICISKLRPKHFFISFSGYQRWSQGSESRIKGTCKAFARWS